MGSPICVSTKKLLKCSVVTEQELHIHISEEKNGQKRLLRRSFRRVINFFICLKICLTFGYDTLIYA